MQKIKSISQKPGWMVFLLRFCQKLIYTVKTAEHLTLEINLLLSQIVLLVFSYKVFSILLAFLDLNIKDFLSSCRATSQHYLKEKMHWFNSPPWHRLVPTCNLTSFYASISPPIKNDILIPCLPTTLCYCGGLIK